MKRDGEGAPFGRESRFVCIENERCGGCGVLADGDYRFSGRGFPPP